MIDVDKFVASIMKCLCMTQREDAYLCRRWIYKALDAQGLKFENGEIVKSQRTMAAEAKEAIFDSEDEKIRKWLICGMNALKEQKRETFATIPIDDAIAWLEKQKPAWSEGDEIGWTNTMIMIKEVASNHYTKDSVKLVIDWLKSLKYKCIWKPTKEHVKAVRLARSFVTDDFGEHPMLSETLIDLEEQLKKLREE